MKGTESLLFDYRIQSREENVEIIAAIVPPGSSVSEVRA